MNSEPAGLDRTALVSALRTWELSITSLSYLPVGAGSHHYLALGSDGRRWFVTADGLLAKLFGMMGPTFTPYFDIDLDAGYDALNRAFRTTVALQRAGLEFVHAPITRPDGEVLERLGDYAVSVFPFIEGISHARAAGRRARLLEALGRLHAATEVVPPSLPQRDSLTVPIKPGFFDSLDDLEKPWTNGPYGESARLLLQPKADAIRDLFHRCEALAEAVRGSGKPWVVTHGQVHEFIVVRSGRESWYSLTGSTWPSLRVNATWGHGATISTRRPMTTGLLMLPMGNPGTSTPRPPSFTGTSVFFGVSAQTRPSSGLSMLTTGTPATSGPTFAMPCPWWIGKHDQIYQAAQRPHRSGTSDLQGQRITAARLDTGLAAVVANAH